MSTKKTLVVIGNGMVGQHFLSSLVASPIKDDYEIVTFCEEPRAAYDRVHLSAFFSGNTAEDLSLVEPGFFEQHGITIHIGDKAAKIYRHSKTVVSEKGVSIRYDKLVLAMISEDLAISKGIKVARVNLLYLFLVSVVVAIGIQIVGTLLVGFLVIVPAIAAKTLSSHMRRYSMLSAVFGAAAGFSGVLIWSIFFGPDSAIPFSGPLVVFSGIIIFAASIVINWRYKLTT